MKNTDKPISEADRSLQNDLLIDLVADIMDVSEYRTRILTPKDRAILLNAAVKGKITKPLSISKMRREILAAMGVKDNRATGYYNSSSSFNRSEIMTIHSFLTSRFRNGIEVKKEKV